MVKFVLKTLNFLKVEPLSYYFVENSPSDIEHCLTKKYFCPKGNLKIIKNARLFLSKEFEKALVISVELKLLLKKEYKLH